MSEEKSENNQYVFVYGTLRKGRYNHRLLENSPLITKGKTKEKFNMRASGIPYVCKEYSDENDNNIIGEVYEVTPQTLKGPLDSLEGHPYVYKRELTTIVGDDDKEYKAWLYFYKHQGKAQAVPSGDFFDTIKEYSY